MTVTSPGARFRGADPLMVLFDNVRRVGAHDPFRRSRGRGNVARSQRIPRACAGACDMTLLGGFLLILPSNPTPVNAGDGAAIARVTLWVQHAAHDAYIDVVHQSTHGAAL